MLSRLAHRPRLLRDYLARNVLAGLPAELHDFMVKTSVLGCLSGSLCDEFLGRDDSEGLLLEIERRQVFLTSTDDGEIWRFHEVLRSLLESVLVETIGQEAARSERSRAGRILKARGAWPEAIYAFCRAEDWDAVRKLLVDWGQEMVEGALGWLDFLPSAVTAQDPWVLLAVARRHLATGRWQSTVESYKKAEEAFSGQGLAGRCQRERLAVTSWLRPLGENTPITAGAPEWARRLQRGLHRDPLGVSDVGGTMAGEPADLLARAVLAFVAGRPDFAARFLDEINGTGPEVVTALARILGAIARWCTGRSNDSDEISSAVEALRCVPVPLVVALADAVVRQDLDASMALLADAEEIWPDPENPWLHASSQLGTGLVALVQQVREDTVSASPERYGTSAAPSGQDVSVPALRRAAERFDALGTQVLRSWALAFLAVALQRQSDLSAAAETAHHAIQSARLCGCPGSQRLAEQVLVSLRDDRQQGASAQSSHPKDGVVDLEAKIWPVRRRDPVGLQPARAAFPPSPPSMHNSLLVEIRCFGRFSLSVNREAKDLSSMRPKSRSLLRWLAMEGGDLIHRETIIAALWPDDDLPAATRKLHVAITSLRQLLNTTELARGAPLLVREGQSYLFTLGSDVRIDTVRFASLLSDAESARVRGDLAVATTALKAALDEYAGELLPEEGPVPWVVDARERYRLQAADAVAKLVGLLRQSSDASPQRMIEACERGLQIDRYADSLWKHLIDIHEAHGDIAKAARLRIQYAEILAELGIRDRS